MSEIIEKYGPVTLLLSIAFVFAALAGAIITVVQPDTLDFNTYLTRMSALAGTLGLLGVGRGIHSAGKAIAKTRPPVLTPVPPRGSPVHMSVGSGVMTPGPTLGNDQEGYADDDGEPGDHFDSLPHVPVTDPSAVLPDNNDGVLGQREAGPTIGQVRSGEEFPA